MSWLFSQALGGEFLEENSLDGEQSVQLSGNPIPQAYCAPDKMTDFSRLSRFGMTFKPLTDALGEELLTWYLEGFHAKTSVQQEKVTDLTESVAECGNTWRGWLAKYDHDLCSWKTAQCSLLGEEQELLATLPRWGMTVDGLLWEQPMLAPHTSERECGLLPTLTVCGNYNRKGASKTSGDGLATVLKRTPTLCARDWKDSGSPSEYNRNEPRLGAIFGGPLNPTWCEWYMGFPLGWTELKVSAMHKSPYVQQQPGEY
jgi:hypothetical protein